MSKEVILMMHPTFGVLALIATVWVFVEALSVSDGNVGRLRKASVVAAALMWLAFIAGGYWYVNFYNADKTIINAGPWPYAHGLFMETKEHVFFLLLLLTTFLPIVAYGNIVKNQNTKKLALWTSALVVLMTLAMEGAGAMISMGAKVALLAQHTS